MFHSPEPPEPRVPGDGRILTPGFVALLLTQISFGFGFSCFFLLPKFMKIELHATASQIGNVTGAFGVSAAVLLLLVGIWVDRTRRRRFVTAGTLGMAVCSFGFVWVEDIGPLIYALRTLQGVAFALTFTASATLVTDLAPPARRSSALALFGVSTLSMNAVAPAVSESIAEQVGWDVVFELAAASCVVAALLSRFVPDDRRPPRREEDVPSLADVMRRPGVGRIAGMVGLTGASFGAMFTFHQPFALELGIPHVRGFFLAYAGVALSVRLLVVAFGHPVSQQRLAMGSLSVYVVSVLWMAGLAPGLLGWIGAVYGLAHGLFYPALSALIIADAGEHDRGKRMGIFNGAFNAGFCIGVPLLGLLAENRGYESVFVVAASGSLVALLLLVSGRGTRRVPGPAGAGARACVGYPERGE